MQLPELFALARSGDLSRRVLALDDGNGDAPAAAAATVDYVRFKPGTSCLFGLGTTTSRPLGYVKIFLSGGAEDCYEKYRSRGRDAGDVHRIPGLDALWFRFPLDRTVAGLEALTDVAKLKHLLHASVPGLGPGEERIRARKSSVSILRYKPERRCLVRADLSTRSAGGESGSRVVVAQAYGDDSGARVHAAMRRLREHGHPALRTPRPLGWNASRRTLIQEFVPGTPWGERLHDPGAASGAALAGRALRELREVAPPDGLRSADAWTATTEAARVLHDLARIAGGELAGAATELASALLRGLGDLRPAPPSLLHGDFHYHQLLVEADSGALIDWDEIRLGDPREDAGNLIAHLRLRELQGRLDGGAADRLVVTFLDAWSPGGPPDGLAQFAAVGLARLALVPFRNLETDWADKSLAIVERARRLAGAAAEVTP